MDEAYLANKIDVLSQALPELSTVSPEWQQYFAPLPEMLQHARNMLSQHNLFGATYCLNHVDAVLWVNNIDPLGEYRAMVEEHRRLFLHQAA